MVSFRILGPWAPEREDTAFYAAARSGERAFTVLTLVTLAAGLLLAFRNLRLGRGDRRGALRLAVFAAVARFTAWLLQNQP